MGNRVARTTEPVATKMCANYNVHFPCKINLWSTRQTVIYATYDDINALL